MTAAALLLTLGQLIPPGEEPLYVFLVVHRGAPNRSECGGIVQKMGRELSKGQAAGRKLTRATLPVECKGLSPVHESKRGPYLHAGRKRVKVEWVDRSQLVAVWARKR